MKDLVEARVAQLKKDVDNQAAQYNFAVGRLEEAQTLLNQINEKEHADANPPATTEYPVPEAPQNPADSGAAVMD
jgi:hypothetical protein